MLRSVVVGGAIIAGVAFLVPMMLEGRIEPSGSAGSQAPAAAKPPAPPPATGRGVRMEADGRGHFIGEFRLNGRAAEAMIDTGASAVAINRSTARRIGLSPANSDFIHPVSTANGTTHAAQVLINRIEIGGIAVRDVPALVLEDTALSGTLIGMSFLSKLRRYQVENGRLFLEQ